MLNTILLLTKRIEENAIQMNKKITDKKRTHSKHHQIKNILESDNPGSTDSEVRKILTLHIPITEYDTLGSESDNEVGARNVNQSKYRQRGKRICWIKFFEYSF